MRQSFRAYHPDHYSIQAAAAQDYEAFYQEEMAYRMLMDYPPAAHMLSVLVSGENEELVEQGMDYLAKFVERIASRYRIPVIGPAYAAVGKVNDIYRKVLYLKHRDERILQDIKDKTEKYIKLNSGFRRLYIQFDYTLELESSNLHKIKREEEIKMAIRVIRTEEDPVLRKISRPVKEVTPKIVTLIDDMLDTMYEAMGVGLAAPQVGILKRIVVIDIGEGPIVLINPEILETSGEQTGDEGCLSVPGMAGQVTRPNYVKVKAMDEDME